MGTHRAYPDATGVHGPRCDWRLPFTSDLQIHTQLARTWRVIGCFVGMRIPSHPIPLPQEFGSPCLA
jgi:hypothetical protein